jgi:hypothetical protein
MNKVKSKLAFISEGSKSIQEIKKEVDLFLDFFNEKHDFMGFSGIENPKNYTIGVPILEEGKDDEQIEDYPYGGYLNPSELEVFITDMGNCLDEFKSDLITCEYGVYNEDDEVSFQNGDRYKKFVYFIFSKK